MKVFVTGACGFIGTHFCLNETRILCHKLNPRVRLNDGVNLELEELSELSTCNTVLHLAGLAHGKYSEQELNEVNHLATLQLASTSAKAGVKRFVFVSSVNVHGNRTYDAPFTELSELDQSIFPSKIQAEAGLKIIGKETGMEITIVRPVLVYGKDAPENMGLLMRMVSKLPFLPFGLVKNKKSFISLGNLSDFLYICCTHKNAGNETFLISDDQAVSTSGLMNAMALGLGKNIYSLLVPTWALYFLGYISGKSKHVQQLIGDLEVDCSKAKNLLDWFPIETMAQAMKKLK
jgi:nucleoside-diphosphate-sugar epimerase